MTNTFCSLSFQQAKKNTVEIKQCKEFIPKVIRKTIYFQQLILILTGGQVIRKHVILYQIKINDTFVFFSKIVTEISQAKTTCSFIKFSVHR